MQKVDWFGHGKVCDVSKRNISQSRCLLKTTTWFGNKLAICSCISNYFSILRVDS